MNQNMKLEGCGYPSFSFWANLRQNLVNSDQKNCLIWQSETPKQIDFLKKKVVFAVYKEEGWFEYVHCNQ
jgi:hypothetical protein